MDASKQVEVTNTEAASIPAAAAVVAKEKLWDKLSKPAAETVKAEPGAAEAEKKLDPQEKRGRGRPPFIAPKMAELKAKEAELLKREAAIEERAKAEFEKFRQDLLGRVKADPLGVIEKEAGLTYEQLTIAALKGNKGKASEDVLAMKKELEAKIEQVEKNRTEEVRKANEEMFKSRDEKYKSDLKSYLDSKKDVYEYTVAKGDFDDVMKFLQDAAPAAVEQGKTIDELLAFYEQQVENDWANKVLATNKAKAKLAPPPVAAAQKPQTLAQKAIAVPQTNAAAVLSNASQPSVASPNSTKPRNKNEAFQMFKKNLGL